MADKGSKVRGIGTASSGSTVILSSQTSADLPVTKSSASTIDDVIRRKLIVDGDGAGDDRRIQSILKTFITLGSLEDVNTTEDEVLFRRLIQQLRQLEYSAKRAHIAIKMNEETKKVYRRLDNVIQEETGKTKTIIRDAKRVIEQETKNRKHSMEYEALSKLIEMQPDRKITDSQRKTLENEVETYSEFKEELRESFINRQRQIKSLAFAMESVRRGIEEDDEKLWGNTSLNTSLKTFCDLGNESFPLEKEVFPERTAQVSSVSSNNGTTSGSGSGSITKPIVPTSSVTVVKVKYEDLSEESPEEGESED